LLRQVSAHRQAQNHRVLEPGGEGGVGFVKIASRIVDVIGSCAGGDSINLDGGAGRGAGDRQSFGKRSLRRGPKRQQRERCIETVSPRWLHRSPPRELVMAKDSHRIAPLSTAMPRL